MTSRYFSFLTTSYIIINNIIVAAVFGMRLALLILIFFLLRIYMGLMPRLASNYQVSSRRNGRTRISNTSLDLRLRACLVGIILLMDFWHSRNIHLLYTYYLYEKLWGSFCSYCATKLSSRMKLLGFPCISDIHQLIAPMGSLVFDWKLCIIQVFLISNIHHQGILARAKSWSAWA